MTLDIENLFNISNQIYPYDQQQKQEFCGGDELLLLPPEEAELFCFESVAPPSLFSIIDQPISLNFQPHDLHQSYHLFQHPNYDIHEQYEFNCLKNNYHVYQPQYDDFTPPMLLPAAEDNINYLIETEDFYHPQPQQQQLVPFAKRQKLFADGFLPDHFVIADDVRRENGGATPPVAAMGGNNNNAAGVLNNNQPIINGDGDKGIRAVSSQSRAARERRRKITEKTQELGKLVPGGTKMNTAEMLQSASKYLKFLQSQLGVLQSLDKLQQESDQKINTENLPILGSAVIQEKLYAKEKCLAPLEILPLLEQRDDFDLSVTYLTNK